CHTWQFLSFEEFEGSAAARGDMCHLVTVAELVYSCCGVAAANDCDSVCICKSFCNCLCSISELRHLEASHRSVPYNSLSCLNSLSIRLRCLRSNVKSHPSVRDFVLSYNLCIGVIGECVCRYSVNRKKQFYPFLF